jgi:hypothetical protein
LFDPKIKNACIYYFVCVDNHNYSNSIDVSPDFTKSTGRKCMLNCFTCNSLLPERGLFCKKCGTQFKCKSCKDFLESDADACVMCGELVGRGDVKNNDFVNISQTMNTFEFRETRNERSAKATFTDNSVDSLKEALSLVVSSYPLGTIVKRQNTKQPQLNGEPFPRAEESFNSDDAIDVTPKQISQVGNETTQKLKRLFFLDENILTLEVQDLKATGPKDFGVRLVYLRLLYSKEIEAKEFILRDDLNSTLKEVMGFLDPNVVSWVSTSNDLSLKEDGDKTYIRLKGDGHTKALGVLEEVYKDELKGTFSPEKKSRHNSKSSSKADSTEKSAKPSGKGRKKGKDVNEWINKWKELDLGIDLHGIAKGLSPLDRVLLALWVIQKSTNGGVNAATTYKLSPIITDLFFAPGDRGNLDKALKDGYKDHLQKTPDGWRITPTGIKHAESLAGMTANEPKSKGKK